ncbi:MAG TPA: menaquinol oxidoreductase [Syntrophomonas sp.]|jgi:cytochrome c|nr:menaquinol oxidoreductase [Syntrophomonas sp.]HQD89975.1 sulfate reduction electron transfer complex DsrMKJOP subunit DsrJ [Syntrophomonadaceae bacterium]
MYNGGKIITGLIIFVLLISAPFWLNVGQANELPDISLDTPAINQLSEKQCVESVEFMRSQHPQLLNDWRDQVVREGESIYVSSSGKMYEMSLDNNCLQCHSNQSQFCDACHTYTSVELYCWDCHGGGIAK